MADVQLNTRTASIKTALGITGDAVGTTDTQTLTNKSGAISQWTNDSNYITSSSTNTLTNKSGSNSQWTNDENYTPSDPTGVTGADQITNMMSLTQAEYDAIGTPNASTLYVITS